MTARQRAHELLRIESLLGLSAEEISQIALDFRIATRWNRNQELKLIQEKIHRVSCRIAMTYHAATELVIDQPEHFEPTYFEIIDNQVVELAASSIPS